MQLPPRKLFFCSLILSLGGTFHFGYLLMVLNPSKDAFISFIHQSFLAHHGSPLSKTGFEALWSVLQPLIFVGTALGALMVAPLSEKLGRKPALYISGILIFAASTISGYSLYCNSYEMLFGGRLLAGIAVGINQAVLPMYLSEISPDRHRGSVTALSNISLNVGILLASIVSMRSLLGSDLLWPFIFWLQIPTTFLMLVLLPFIKESPKFLLACEKENLARESVEFWHSNEILEMGESEINDQLHEFRLEIAEQAERMTFGQLWTKPALRKGVLLGLLSIFAIAFSGIAAMDYYSVPILQEANVSESTASYINVAANVAPLITAIISGVLVDVVGRRPLLLSGLIGLMLLNFWLMVSLALYRKLIISFFAYTAIACVVLFTAVLSFGPGAVQFLIVSELVPQKARAAALGFTAVVGSSMNFLSGLVFLPLNDLIKSYSFCVYILPLLLSVVIFHKFLPETKGRPINEIVKELANESSDAEPIVSSNDDTE